MMQILMSQPWRAAAESDRQSPAVLGGVLAKAPAAHVAAGVLGPGCGDWEKRKWKRMRQRELHPPGRIEQPGPPSGQRHMVHHLRLVVHRCPGRHPRPI